MNHIFVTGASGFLGKGLLSRLQTDGHYRLSASVRTSSASLPGDVTLHMMGSIDADTPWLTALEEVDVVVHCAARVHVMADTSQDPLQDFRKVNVDATLQLAREAAKAGVRRFIFISSIKVNGEQTEPGRPYKANGIPQPLDPYGISKLEAETALYELAETVDMDVVVIRPVLVYGPGVKANFQAMMRWLDRGVPLPFGAIHNGRSLVALDNLVDLIVTAISHPAAANQTFLVSDGEDLSTTQLLRRMAHALGKRPLLLPVPSYVLSVAAKLLGQRSLAQRLCGSLQVDITKTRKLLQWAPPVSVDTALKVTALHYMENKNND
ncbi:SDR family oxidoreductase [Pseudomonas sp. S5D5]|uniref:UDP-glucose 4-epimerase family protein n=1 Tax=Pseudomonas sp. S5D5 TaxID=2083056 RepID=UPI000D10D426